MTLDAGVLVAIGAAIALISFIFGAVWSLSSKTPEPSAVTIEIGSSVRMVVAVADDPDELTLGLQGIDALPPATGMLFVFPGKERILSLWMRNTWIPLDAAFFTADGVLLNVEHMTPCEDLTGKSCEVFRSSSPAKYAVEAAGGSFAELRPGDRLSIAPSSLLGFGLTRERAYPLPAPIPENGIEAPGRDPKGEVSVSAAYGGNGARREAHTTP